MNDKDKDVDEHEEGGPESSERAPTPKGRNLAVSHHGRVSSHATSQDADKAQDAHHRTAVARHHRSVGRVVNGKK